MGPHLFLSSAIIAAVFLQRLEGQLIGSSQPIVVLAGNDIILPCHLEPTADLSDQAVEWSRPGTSVTIVHVHRDGEELSDAKGESYVCRTELFVNELKNGNISLKLFRVKRSDEGTYKCSVPPLRIESLIELRVGVVSLPTTSVVGTKDGGVDLQCESGGWYPEPEVEWLDSEGHVLSAGPTETLRDPDSTFTVRRHVTVHQTATNRFTCRVQQQHISKTRETVIHVPDSLFAVPAWKWIVGVLVIAVIAIAIFLYWLKRKNDTMKRRFLKINELRMKILSEELRRMILRDMSFDVRPGVLQMSVDGPGARRPQDEESKEAADKEPFDAAGDPPLRPSSCGDPPLRPSSCDEKPFDAAVRCSSPHHSPAAPSTGQMPSPPSHLEEDQMLMSSDEELRMKILREELRRKILREMSSDARPEVPLMLSVDGGSARRPQGWYANIIPCLRDDVPHPEELRMKFLSEELRIQFLSAMSSDVWPGVPAMSVDGRGARRPQEELRKKILSDMSSDAWPEVPAMSADGRGARGPQEELRKKILSEGELRWTSDEKPFDAAEELRMKFLSEELRMKFISDMPSDARPGVPAMSVDGRGARRPQDEELKEAAEVC